ncbi:DNA breaking-rejoining enzyme, partial [Mycena rebaudengoi]
MLHAHVDETRESYGAGLLHFHQFCDREGFGEDVRMPADRSCTGKCIRNWLNGLRLWHHYNDAPWHGDDGWLVWPITLSHLRALCARLDLSSPSGTTHWVAALSTFWGCRRLGEMLPCSVAKFTTLHDTCRSTRSPDLDLCPVRAWDEHVRINHSPPPNTSLFVFRSTSAWHHLLKSPFLEFTAAELLSAGIVPEIIMKLGGWTSLYFLIYWRRLEKILPLAITPRLGCTDS